MRGARVDGSEICLEAENLVVSFAGRTAVDHVCLNVKAGEVVGLLGPNGAGKSTTLHAMLGIVTIDGGSVRIHGEEVTRLPAWKRKRKGISCMLQGERVFRNLTVMENLRVAGEFMHSWREADVLDLLRNRFERLLPKLRDRAGSLSGGERQMLALAQALVSRPKILLLDEPSLGISDTLLLDLGTHIRRLRDEGTAMVIVEQNADFCSSVMDRGYMMDSGRISERWPSRERAQ